MLSLKLLMAFTVLTGIVAEQCTLADFGVEDFADKVTVSNTSDAADAFVAIKYNHGQVSMSVPAGESRSAIFLASTKYTAVVTEPGDNAYGDYRARLVELRDTLLQLTVPSPYVSSPEAMVNVWTELGQVQAALDQMTTSAKVQSCSGKLKTDVTSLVTIKRVETSDGAALWALDCG